MINVYTNEKTRSPRKLKKGIKRQGCTPDALYKSKYQGWEVFVLPDNGWARVIRK